MTQLIRRLRYLLNRRRLDRELASDMEFHREMLARDGHGRLGNTLRIQEEARDAWGWTWIERLSQDLRFASRLIRKSPGFTLAAVAILAIGIGVNVAAFGFFDLLLLRPLHVRDPQTLVRFHRRSPDAYAFVLPYPEMDFFRENSRTLSAVLAMNIGRLAVEGEEKQSNTHFVTANFFTELGAVPIVGRTFNPTQDDTAAAPPVVVISQGFWNRRFAGDRSVAGKIIRLNGKPATIIGVASAQFSGLSLDPPDLWIPIKQQPFFLPGSRLLTDFSNDTSGVEMWGRLQPDTSPKAAELELASLAARLRRQHPADIWDRESLPGEPGGYAKSLMMGGSRGSGSETKGEIVPIVAMIAVLCLLILAVSCGNLGSLLLARGLSRSREMSIRVALGAGRARLVRQLFTESILLALLGSLAALALGYFTLRALFLLTESPAWLNPLPDWRVIVFSIAAGFLAAILFGLAPATQIIRRRHNANTTRHVLVGAQLAASCVLVILAGLLVRALTHVTTVDPGFEYQRVFTLDLGLASHGYIPAQSKAYLDTLKNRLLRQPGVESVALALSPPLGNRSESAGVELNGHPIDVQINHVDPQFFRTMNIPLLRGRNLTNNDKNTIIISESLARRWPTGDPLGKTFSMGADYTVVGIAGSARTIAIQNSDAVEVYLPIDESNLPATALVVRTSTPPGAIARAAVLAAKSLDPQISPDVQLLKNRFELKLHGAQYGASTVAILGLAALLIACIGIVGLVSFTVVQRTKEIGIRMALGARPSQVLTIVLRRFAIVAVIGLLAGAGIAAASSQLLRRELYGISNLDPLAFTGAITAFILTVALAALLSARRALQVDPLQSLRYE